MTAWQQVGRLITAYVHKWSDPIVANELERLAAKRRDQVGTGFQVSCDTLVKDWIVNYREPLLIEECRHVMTGHVHTMWSKRVWKCDSYMLKQIQNALWMRLSLIYKASCGNMICLHLETTQCTFWFLNKLHSQQILWIAHRNGQNICVKA